ncbi:MAG: alpha-amylase family glycosyl hydrolase [Dermatophilaceae bacterium]
MSTDDLRGALHPLVELLYPADAGDVTSALVALTDRYRARLAARSSPRPTHATSVLISYADTVRRAGQAPLRTLDELLTTHGVGRHLSDVHLLPMFPWTSDDGFAVVDHRRVSPDHGTWDDVEHLSARYRLVFDFVANHTSSSSPWFLAWLDGDPRYDGYYLERDPEFDTSTVVRPRTTPLFHSFADRDGASRSVWTTFGPDQVDVDLRTSRVLLELTDILLTYVAHGAHTVRLDAVGFLWKESGTTCLHLPQTHAVIKIWRAVLDDVCPGTQLLTETNVPHEENISYFGNGHDEAHLVYQFALPPLVLHAFVRGSTAALRRWASTITPVSTSATWLNFLASHDGIGMRATEGILSDTERDLLVQRTRAHGGEVSMAARPDGSTVVYELNIGYLDALCSPDELARPDIVAAKALAAHSILLSFVGVPAIYIHSLLGSASDFAGMRRSGTGRRVNREVLDVDQLLDELAHQPRRHEVFAGIDHLLAIRATQPGLSPYASQSVDDLDDRVIAIRRAAGTVDELLSVTNVSAQPVVLEVAGHDVLTCRVVDRLVLPPYGFAWLRTS